MPEEIPIYAPLIMFILESNKVYKHFWTLVLGVNITDYTVKIA